MSLKNIINLISQYPNDEDSPEIGWIKWRHGDCLHPFRFGTTIIESSRVENISYTAYIVCVKDEDTEDLTDAEEEITMTPMICSNKTRSNSFTTVIPDSDDGEDSDDSINSIILSSQENNKKRDVKKSKTTASLSQINESNTLEQSSSIHLHLEASVSDIHDVETQAIEIDKFKNPTKCQGDVINPIYEAETQDFALNNVYKQIQSDCKELPKQTLDTAQVSAVKTVESLRDLDDPSPSIVPALSNDIYEAETQQIVLKSNEIHEIETQQIFKVPESRKPPEDKTIVPKENNDEDSLDVRDSQICDFDGFTEDFDIQQSQSLIIDIGGMPEIPEPPKLPSIKEDDQLAPEEADVKPKDDSNDLSDPTIETEMADLDDDELTQIISLDDIDAGNVSVANKTLDIYEMATQMPHGIVKSSPKESSPDIYSMPTQYIVKDNEADLNTSKDIYNALTQCILKEELSDGDSTDIEDDIVIPKEEITSQMEAKEAEVENPAEVEDDDDTLTQIVEPDVIDDCIEDKNKTVIAEEPQTLNDEENDENMTQVVEERPVNNEGEVRNEVKTPSLIDAEPCVSNAEEPCIDDDVYNLATQVIITDEIRKEKTCVNSQTIDTKPNVLTIDTKPNVVKSCDKESDDIYDLATQVITTDDASSKTNDVGGDDIFMATTQLAQGNTLSNESMPSPISKMVFLTSDNFSRETSIDSRKNLLDDRSEKTHLGKKIVGSLKSADNFTFSTPNKEPVKKKKKTVHNSNKDMDVTVALKNIVPSVEVSPPVNDTSDANYYNNTQEVAADLMASDISDSTTMSKPQQKDSPGKENAFGNRQSNFYQSTQEVLNDLCTQKSTVSNKDGKDDSFYNSTQDVYNDLVAPGDSTFSKEFTKVPTPTNKVMLDVPVTLSYTHSSESSDEIFKSPLKRKIKYTISDSELDSPQIEIFASKMLSNFEVNSNSDYDDAPPEESQDTPIVFRKAVPTKKNKNPVKNNLNDRFDAPAQKVASVKNSNVDSPTKEVKPSTSGNNARRKRPANLDDEDDVIPKPNTRNKKPFVLDSDSPSDSEGVIKIINARNKKRFILDSDSTSDSEIMNTRKANELSKRDASCHSKSTTESKKTSKPRKGKNTKAAKDVTEKVSTTDVITVDITGTRRSSRVRTANRKYEDPESPISISSGSSVGRRVSRRNSSVEREIPTNTKKTSPRESRNNSVEKEAPKSKSKKTSETKTKKSEDKSNANDSTKDVGQSDKSLDVYKNCYIKLTPPPTGRTRASRGQNSASENKNLKDSKDNKTYEKNFEDISEVSIAIKMKSAADKRNTTPSTSASDCEYNTTQNPRYKNCKVMFTFIEVMDNGLRKTIEALGGSVVEKDGQVLVAPQPCKRTVKVLLAAAKGIPIVSQQWVARSQKAGHFLDPWNHLLKCKVLEAKCNIPLEIALRTPKPYLKEWLIYITPKVKMPPEQLKELVEVSGGNVVLVPKTATRRTMKTAQGEKGTLSVSCLEDAQLWSILPDPIVSYELLLQGSFSHEVKIDPYKLN